MALSPEEIKKKLAEFYATMKPKEPAESVKLVGPSYGPVSKKATKKVVKKLPPPVSVQQVPEPVATLTPDACFNHEFIHMVDVLPDSYIGESEAKYALMNFMTQVIGECPTEEPVA